MKTVTTWIVVADGAQASVFENTGPHTGLTPVKEFTFSQEPLKSQDIASDKPGRTFSSVGDSRSAMPPPTDPAAKREDDFTREIANRLAEAVQDERFDRLVLAAAPRALGNLRTHMNRHVQDRIVEELPKDLTNVPLPDLPQHFDDKLRL